VRTARPTARGLALLAVALITYVTARVVGTWELYFLAFAFLAAVGLCWVLVVLSVRRLQVIRTVTPQQPAAGDPLTLSFRVKNGSRLPGLQVTLVDAGGTLGGPARSIDVESLGSRAERVAASQPWPARRGIHRLAAQTVVAEDPLGLVRARRDFGDALAVTVPPRLAHLPSWDVYAGTSARTAGRRRRLPTIDASEFRGIRQHNPGEPLNRVDWKATAKTGSLMLRELEDAADGGVAVLFNGPAAHLAGELPETNFEVGIRAAGSIADCALRSGHRVTLLLPEHEWRPVRLSPDAESRRRLLTVLAAAKPGGLPQLGPSLKALVARTRKHERTRSLTLIVLSLDRPLVRAVAALREEGLPVCVVHAGGRTEAAAGDELDLKRGLAAAGVRYVALREDDDLGQILSAPGHGRRARAR
jgi:uncharacterized protein (DUF58 family)